MRSTLRGIDLIVDHDQQMMAESIHLLKRISEWTARLGLLDRSDL
jgi:hypothetical protein